MMILNYIYRLNGYIWLLVNLINYIFNNLCVNKLTHIYIFIKCLLLLYCGTFHAPEVTMCFILSVTLKCN